MKNNLIDDFYRSRIENVESKTSIDDFLMWRKVNESLTNNKRGTIYKKVAFYIGLSAIAFSVAAAFSVHLYNNYKRNKEKQISTPSIQNNSTLKQNQTKEIKTEVNKISTNKQEPVKPIETNKNKKSVELIIENHNSDIKSEKILTKPIDLISNKSKIEENLNNKVATIVNDTLKTNTLIKKVLVVKKHVIKKDSIVNVKRVRHQ